jgi:methionyl aminopeptidase
MLVRKIYLSPNSTKIMEEHELEQEEAYSLEDPKTIEKLKLAGSIAKQVREYIRPLVIKDASVLEIVNKIEDKIVEIGGKPAFPATISINEVAAHATPLPSSEENCKGLIKVDFGVQVEGFIADQAFTLDLENSDENKKLIETAELALKAALDVIKPGVNTSQIGNAIQTTIEEAGFRPIRNLSGHSIAPFLMHAGETIPNYDNKNTNPLEPGVYATEPFCSKGSGAVKDGKPSSIFSIKNEGNVRDNFAREVLAYILKEYQTLPFCTRWLHKKFGARAALALRQLEQAGIVYQYPQLIERSGASVAQAEHTIILTDKEKIITTK